MQNAIQIGDLVTFLDEVGEGCVIAVDGNQVQVQVGDFSRWHDLEELIPRDRAMDHLLSNGPVKQKDLEIQAINEPALPSMQAAKLGAREVDLHLHELPPLHIGATDHEKLLHQLHYARTAITQARSSGERKLVLIHGKGTGRLRHELEQMLRKDQGLRYYDASYQLFGQGALEVEILRR
jgi:hypothetical protein